jgi:hypothetical protein
MAFVYFVVTFWIDKYLLLFVNKKPIQLDCKMANALVNNLVWGIVFHIIAGFFMYSNVDLFPLNADML